MEASGTSNMKFVMNGSCLIGTWDGANVEISEEVGPENEFIFGARVEQIEELRAKMRETNPDDYFSPNLKRVLRVIDEGMFGKTEDLIHLINTIRHNNDYYLVGADFESYCEA